MHSVRELHCASPGLPRAADLDWRRVALGSVRRTDPFTGREVVAADWQAAEAAPATAFASAYERVVLSAAEEWAPAARGLAANHAALHDGHLVELWSLVIGDARAQAAWAPSFITPDRESQLLTFPADVTRWLASAHADVIAEAVGRWAELPYLEAAGGEQAHAIAECAFQILVPLARIAVRREAEILAMVSGYVSA